MWTGRSRGFRRRRRAVVHPRATAEHDPHGSAITALHRTDEQVARRRRADGARVSNHNHSDRDRSVEPLSVTHQWMWDRVSLPHGLEVAGFSDPRVLTNTGSQIPDWGGLPRRDARRAGVQARLALRRSPEVELAHKHHSQLPHPGRILPLGDQ